MLVVPRCRLFRPPVAYSNHVLTRPNVCVVEEVPGTSHKVWTECKYWHHRDICGQKPVIRYECCEGYQQARGERGCTGVKPLKNVLETARELGASQFVEHLEQSGLAADLAGRGVYTLFAPLDSAFQEMSREQKARLDSYRGRRLNPVLLYHMLNKRLASRHFGAHRSVETRHSGHRLHLNKYSSGMETVNCAAIVRKDQEASNGVVHVISSVLDPSLVDDRSLVDVVMQDGRFSELAKAMQESQFVERLRSSQQPYTFLAPSDEAFQKIPQKRLQRILANTDAREALLQNHVIPHPMCVPAVLEGQSVHTAGSEKLQLDCDRRGVTVGASRLRADLSLGRDGVLYMLDDVLLPDRAKSLLQLAEQERLFGFLQVVKAAGMDDALENFGEYTLFAPSEAAMYSMPSERFEQLRSNKELARKFVMYHATQGRLNTDEIADNQVVMSLDEQNPLRMQVYRRATGVEDALIDKPDVDGLNGCLHVINKALSPASTSAGDVLRHDGNFSIFLTAMEKVMEKSPETLALESPDTSYTFFVPTDQAFNKLGETRLHKIMDDDSYLTRTIKNHVVENMYASEGFRSDLYYDIQTRQNMVDVFKKNGKLKVNDAMMTKCDLLNTNGVIHVINKVLLPERRSRG
ncbi:periostin-like isoform X2 [Bacillus rossius redtenbacheri]|uniref:periostin-like isoform X2 n=1 Tax=Bacillus rossius redtenbacheri TaxID=93214 RepID=UPI002FDC88BE